MSQDMTNSHPITKDDTEISSGSSFKSWESAFLHCIYSNRGRQASVAWRLKLEIRSIAVRIMEDTSNCPCHSLNYSFLLHHLISSPLPSEAFHGKNFSSAIYPPGWSALHIKVKIWPQRQYMNLHCFQPLFSAVLTLFVCLTRLYFHITNTIAECSFPSINNLLNPLNSTFVSFPHFKLGWILH